MSTPIPRIEAGDVRQFTVVYSGVPSTPRLALYTGSGDGTLVYSVTGTASSTTAFYAFYTFPNSRMLYVAEWVGSFTAGPVTFRDYVQVIKTTPG